ncbi:MAG: DUF2599 domain-containing protein [Propionibacterium sp.]|nr:DUF2599 domain-containing protein [Propionibacterium sp.]
MLIGAVQIDGTGITAEPTSGVEAASNDDGSVLFRIAVPAGESATRLELHITPSTVDTVVNGGMAVIASRTGQKLAGVPLPTALDVDAQPVPVEMRVIDSALVLLVTPEERHSGEVVVELWVGRDMIADVTVGEEQGEPRYFVTRTAFGHTVLGGGLGTPGARELVEEKGWEQAVAMEPALAELPTLQQQFDCHVLGAPRKESWNLEAFRPDHPEWLVGALEHRCNWTDADLPQPEPSES